MKYIHVVIIILLSTMSSCQNLPDKIEYYSTGEILQKKYYKNDSTIIVHEFYKTGQIKSRFFLINGQYEQKYTDYYKNGQIKATGQYIKGKVVGWNYYYTEDGLLQSKLECVLFSNKNYQNQFILFNKKGEIVKEKSNFFTLSCKSDTIMYGEDFELTIELVAPYFNNVMDVTIGSLDSLYDIIDSTKFIVYRPYDFKIEHIVKSPQRGKNTIRGYIIEFSKINEKDSMADRKAMFFTKYFFVK